MRERRKGRQNKLVDSIGLLSLWESTATMVSKKVENALIKQVEIEAYSSQVYLSMASWAETKGLNGVAKFCYGHADEERMHMLKLIKYINERGGHAVIPALKQPPKTFKNARAIFKQIFSHEQKVSKDINGVVEICLKEKDYLTHNFMQWYVAEQIEEEALASQMLDKLNLIGEDNSGMYLFDRDLESFEHDEAEGQ